MGPSLPGIIKETNVKRPSVPSITASLAGLGLVALAATACSGAASTKASAVNDTVPIPSTVPAGTTLHVGDQFGSLQLPLKLSGQDTDLPYKTVYSSFVGAPAVLQGFRAGAVDFSFFGDAGIIPPQEAGQDLVVVAASKTSGGAGWGVLVGKGKDINSIADLRGKKIGYAAGTASQSFLLQLLKNYGLKPSDLTLVNINTAASSAALKSGAIDATVSTQPLLQEYLAANPGSKLINTPNVYSGLDFLVTTHKALENPAKAAAIADYIARQVKATKWRNAHLSAWTNAYYVQGFKVPAAVAAQIASSTTATNFVPIDAAVIAEQQATTDLFTAAGAIPTKLDVSKIFDTQFNPVVEKALTS
jgi:sulfonate transport system substrate-binding protein